MAIYGTLAAKFGFTDETNRIVQFSPFNPDYVDGDQFKQRVIDFNANVPAAFQSTFLSDNGASCTKILEATFTVTEKTPVFAKTSALMAAAMREEDEPNGNDG